MSTPRTIIVVEDEAPIADAISRYLGACGWDVLVCHDPVRGLDAVIADPPFAVLTDLAMPGMDGGVLVRRIREALGPDSPRIVIISANEPDPGDGELADLVCRKPFRVSELERVLSGWADRDTPASERSGTRLKRPARDADVGKKKKSG